MVNVLATNTSFTKSTIISADNFVDFKRKAASELEMTGWLKVVVHKGRSAEDISRSSFTGVNVSVESFPYIDFENSILVVSRAERPTQHRGGEGRVKVSGTRGDDGHTGINIHSLDSLEN
eukprot:TRINITY_DN37589_c0_g1_i1.p1 TRINITY_DN37589_c0_g1~~TRINITY_DN37589_c0_g1_i1.p1  ORF type:complete len:120 (-),score=22.99 TRINITY_DN37589_c0_g1_i1:88-447(-)